MLLRLIALVVLGFAIGRSGLAQSGATPPAPSAQHSMRFFIGWSGGNHAGAEWLAAEGTITRTTPADFRQWLQRNPSYGGLPLTVYLDSPGGDLMAGLELGLLFRERRFSTAVGRTVLSDDARRDPAGPQTKTTLPGRCVSACAYAFLGGHNRRAKTGEIGFHQFYPARALRDAVAREFNAADLSATQVTVGLIALYLKELAIDPEVLFLASAQAPGGMSYPPEPELRRLRITNHDFRPVAEPWTIEPVGGGAVVATTIRIDALQDVRIAMHCRRSAPDVVVLRGAWTYSSPDRFGTGRPGSGAALTESLRRSILSSSLMIGRTVVRSHSGTSGLLDARVDDDGTHRIAFAMTLAEYRRGLAEGFSVTIDLPGVLGYGQSFTPPITGLAERMSVALRACV